MYKKVGSECKIVLRFHEIKSWTRSAQEVVPIAWIKSEDEFTFPNTTTQNAEQIVVILFLGYRASYLNICYGNKNRGKN